MLVNAVLAQLDIRLTSAYGKMSLKPVTGLNLNIESGNFLTVGLQADYYISDNFTPDSRKILTIALSLWFVLDSLGSLLNNLEYNVILNLSFLCAGLVALYYTPKSADKE